MALIAKADREKVPVNICSWIYSMVSQDYLYHSGKGNVERFSKDGELNRIFFALLPTQKCWIKKHTNLRNLYSQAQKQGKKAPPETYIVGKRS